MSVSSDRLYLWVGWVFAQASVKIAVDMVREGLITEREALLRIDAEKVRRAGGLQELPTPSHSYLTSMPNCTFDLPMHWYGCGGGGHLDDVLPSSHDRPGCR